VSLVCLCLLFCLGYFFITKYASNFFLLLGVDSWIFFFSNVLFVLIHYVFPSLLLCVSSTNAFQSVFLVVFPALEICSNFSEFSELIHFCSFCPYILHVICHFCLLNSVRIKFNICVSNWCFYFISIEFILLFQIRLIINCNSLQLPPPVSYLFCYWQII